MRERSRFLAIFVLLALAVTSAAAYAADDDETSLEVAILENTVRSGAIALIVFPGPPVVIRIDQHVRSITIGSEHDYHQIIVPRF